MSNEDFSKNIAAFLAQNPGAIADEIGVSPVIMGRLEAEGLVIRVGKRQTGKRGRPPVEWALPDTEGVVAAEPNANLPKLADATAVREFANGTEAGILAYIERVFEPSVMILNPKHPAYGTWVSGTRPGEEGEKDYKLLAGRYKEIVGQIERRVGRNAA